MLLGPNSPESVAVGVQLGVFDVIYICAVGYLNVHLGATFDGHW